MAIGDNAVQARIVALRVLCGTISPKAEQAMR